MAILEPIWEDFGHWESQFGSNIGMDKQCGEVAQYCFSETLDWRAR